MAATAAESGIVRTNIADISADLIAQTALLGEMNMALSAIQRDAADTSADLMVQTGLLGEIRDELIAAAGAADVYNINMRQARDATAATFGGFGRFGVGAGLFTFGNILTVLHLVLAGFGAQIVADTIGITAFGMAATSVIGPAVTAASSVQNLTTQYQGLDNYQKAATLSIKSFTDGLQTADEAGVLGVFYQGLALVQGELGKGNGIVTQATNAFGDFFGMLKADLGSKAWADVFSGTSNIIRTDLDSLFKLINAGINVIPGLFHNLNFLGTGLLNVATGTLKAVGAVTEWNPMLTKTAALAGVAYGAYKLLWAGLGAGPGPLQVATMGLVGFGTRVATASTYMSEGVGVAASYGLGIGAISGSALTAAAGIGAFVLAGVGLYALFSRKDAIQSQISQMQQLDGAVGNNVAGYQKMDAALQQNIEKLQADGQVHVTTMGNINTHGFQVFSNGAIAVGDYNQALQANQQILSNIQGNAVNFGTVLGITSKQAIAAANATGIDLTHGLSTSGSQFAIDAGKIQGYVQAVRLSHNPLSQMRVDAQQASNAANSLHDQLLGLAGAFNSLLGPYQSVIQGNVTFRNDLITLKQDMATSGNQVGYWNTSVKNSASAMATAVGDAMGLSNAIKTQTGSTRLAVGPLQTMLNFLRSTGSQSAITRHEIQILQDTIDALHGKNININVRTNFSQTGAPAAVSGSTLHGVLGPSFVANKAGSGPANQSIQFSGPAAAAGGGNLQLHVYLDGRELHAGVARATFDDNVRNGNRASDGRVRGTLVPRPA